MRIRIPIDKCVPEIDDWLDEYVGYGNWCEWRPGPFAPNVPYRCIEIYDDKLMSLFIMTWL